MPMEAPIRTVIEEKIEVKKTGGGRPKQTMLDAMFPKNIPKQDVHLHSDLTFLIAITSKHLDVSNILCYACIYGYKGVNRRPISGLCDV